VVDDHVQRVIPQRACVAHGNTAQRGRGHRRICGRARVSVGVAADVGAGAEGEGNAGVAFGIQRCACGYRDEAYLKLKIIAIFLPELPENAHLHPH